MTGGNPLANECCGEEHKTMFCPHCGTKLNAAPLDSLLSYVRSMAKRILSGIPEREARLAAMSDERKRFTMQKGMDKSERKAAKWKAWEDALLDVLRPDDKWADDETP